MPRPTVSGPIRRVLVANRGEIAVRIMRTCRDLGIETVAVFSEPDRHALHVRMADLAFPIGPAEATQSYLNQDVILETARSARVDAIHPGYGFLSESARFAEACEDAGLRFIGPPAEAIRAMGDKTKARALMSDAGVPMAPGTPNAVGDVEEALALAKEIGFPVLIKAAAGGGGKGMRQVLRPDDFTSAFQMASSEARSAFGDDRVYLEKYLEDPRHVEFQILADRQGHTVHLFERECSIQRRHQKVIEEAPSPVLDEALRARMGAAAVAAARSCGYVGAGTVEFLLDGSGAFYFMEMNTRIQVEHPVTEMITGIDLVEEQIRIAEGMPLSFHQEDVAIRGHAIECRIYAEDPATDFMPSPGRITHHVAPHGPGVRLDGGVLAGDEVLVHYDPMIAKLVVWGSSREQAIRRMRRALVEYEISGVRTTIPFCQFVMNDEAFARGEVTTHYVAERYRPAPYTAVPEATRKAGIIAAALFEARRNQEEERLLAENGNSQTGSPWVVRRRSLGS